MTQATYRQQNDAFSRSVRENAARREREMQGIRLFIQMNLAELCREKVQIEDQGLPLHEEASMRKLERLLEAQITQGQATSLALRMVADEAACYIARQ